MFYWDVYTKNSENILYITLNISKPNTLLLGKIFIAFWQVFTYEYLHNVRMPWTIYNRKVFKILEPSVYTGSWSRMKYNP